MVVTAHLSLLVLAVALIVPCRRPSRLKKTQPSHLSDIQKNAPFTDQEKGDSSQEGVILCSTSNQGTDNSAFESLERGVTTSLSLTALQQRLLCGYRKAIVPFKGKSRLEDSAPEQANSKNILDATPSNDLDTEGHDDEYKKEIMVQNAMKPTSVNIKNITSFRSALTLIVGSSGSGKTTFVNDLI